MKPTIIDFSELSKMVDQMVEMMKSIPKYAPGQQPPGGLAIVGEVGPELMIGPNGEAIMAFSRTYLRELPTGTKVVPAPPSDI